MPGVLRRVGQEPMPGSASSSPFGSSPYPQISIFAHLFPTRHKVAPGRSPGSLEVNVVDWPQGLSFQCPKTSLCSCAPRCVPI